MVKITEVSSSRARHHDRHAGTIRHAIKRNRVERGASGNFGLKPAGAAQAITKRSCDLTVSAARKRLTRPLLRRRTR